VLSLPAVAGESYRSCLLFKFKLVGISRAGAEPSPNAAD